MCDLLPQCVHDVLDNFETSLSLPFIVIIVLCTLQFAITHCMHICCIVKDILRKRARKANRCPKPKPRRSDSCGLVDRFKAMFGAFFKAKCPEKCPRKPKSTCKRRCPKKRCSTTKGGGDWDDDYDDGDDLLGLDDL